MYFLVNIEGNDKEGFGSEAHKKLAEYSNHTQIKENKENNVDEARFSSEVNENPNKNVEVELKNEIASKQVNKIS